MVVSSCGQPVRGVPVAFGVENCKKAACCKMLHRALDFDGFFGHTKFWLENLEGRDHSPLTRPMCR